MADEEVREILTQLKLEYLIESFIKNKITIDILRNISEELISELVPIIGDRLTFLEYWRKNISLNQSNVLNITNRKRDRDGCVKLIREGQEKCIQNENASVLANMSCNVFNSNLLKPIPELLNETQYGKYLYQKFQMNDLLSDKDRGSLCLSIITDLENRNIRLDNKLADNLSRMIVNTFSSESRKTYYVPPISKKDSKNNKSIPARGKLLSLWRNRQHKHSIFLKAGNDKTDCISSTASHDQEVPDDIVKNSLNWLEYNQAPWELVEENWKKTSTHRIKTLQQASDNNLRGIFDTWKLYKHPNGRELINIDFENMNLTKVTLTKETWLQFFDTVLKYTLVNYNDVTAKNFVQMYKSDQLLMDSKVAISIFLLAHLFPPKVFKKLGNKSFKPSIGLAKDSIIQFANMASGMADLRQKTRTKAIALKLTIQPYIICIGTIENIEQIYVSVDVEMYKVDDIIQALDILFKTFHVFNLNYPLSSEHIWTLIQRGVYKLHLPVDNEFSSTQYILKQLDGNNLQQAEKEIQMEKDNLFYVENSLLDEDTLL